MSGNDSYTKLLIHSDDSDGSVAFNDTSVGGGYAVTSYGNTHHEVDQHKFGATAIQFDGTGDYLTVPASDDWNLGSGDFTIDFWILTTSSVSYECALNRPSSSSFTSGNYALLYNQGTANGLMAFWCADYSSSSAMLVATTSIRDGGWHHIAVVRNGTSWKLYIDGTAEASRTSSLSIGTSAQALYIGNDRNFAPRDMAGYIDELRVSKGIARWTSDFTPPTEPYTATESLSDFSLDLAVQGYQVDLFKMILEIKDVWLITDFKLNLDAVAQIIDFFKMLLEVVLNKLDDFKMLLEVTDGTVFDNFAMLLAVVNGTVFDNFRMDLSVVSATPAFRSVTAHRLSSVLSEVV
jgi:hypothetical protein